MVALIPPKPQYNSFEVPTRISKDHLFENFVLNHLFPSGLYTCIPQTGYFKNTGRFPKKILTNRLLLRDNTSGFEFHVACKYHFGFIANSFTFSKMLPVGSYKGETDRPLIWILGLGGTAEAPLELFLVNTEVCPYVHLHKRHLAGKAISATVPVEPASLLKQLLPTGFLSKRIA